MGGTWYPNVIATACVWPCLYTSIDMVYSHDWDCNEIKKNWRRKIQFKAFGQCPCLIMYNKNNSWMLLLSVF